MGWTEGTGRVNFGLRGMAVAVPLSVSAARRAVDCSPSWNALGRVGDRAKREGSGVS